MTPDDGGEPLATSPACR